MILHYYLLLNGALIGSYILTRLILNTNAFKQILQIHRLQFARYSLLSALPAVFAGQQLIKLFPSTDSGFVLTPIVKMASASIMRSQPMLLSSPIQTTAAQLPSLNFIIMICFVMGLAYFLGKHIYNIIKLAHINKNSYCRRKINNIYILFNDTTAIPFCWSFINKHYVVIPTSFLMKHEDLKLAIRHELQHIRQHDTQWLHIISIINIIFFCNPVMKLWLNWFDELQEFSCDETLMLRKKTSASAYAQCLVDAASGLLTSKSLPHGALGINGLSNKLLHRRVTMLFDYKQLKTKKLPLLIAGAATIAVTTAASLAFASTSLAPLHASDVAALIKQSNLNTEFQVTARPEVVREINKIRGSQQARSYMQASLQRMKQHEPQVSAASKNQNMPQELKVIPLVESGYQQLPENVNPVKAAGIWQIVPGTAMKYGLTVNSKQDDRMDMTHATKAALQLLADDYSRYNNWKLAFVAYEIGEKQTDALINATGSRDAWTLASSPQAPASLKKTLAAFDAELIIMQNPSLIKA